MPQPLPVESSFTAKGVQTGTDHEAGPGSPPKSEAEPVALHELGAQPETYREWL